jgi:ubiquinone/menaquinone biosynthesis C-methylase UbiE
MNAYNLQLLDHSIDAVIEIDMLHQVDKPQLVMDEIKRVLKYNGLYIKYGSSGLEYTETERIQNQFYTQTLKDIQDFYHEIIADAGHSDPPFSSWQAAASCQVPAAACLGFAQK